MLPPGTICLLWCQPLDANVSLVGVKLQGRELERSTQFTAKLKETGAIDHSRVYVHALVLNKTVVGLERGPLSLVSTTEELLDRKVAAPV
jgi:hypothetical protein